MAAAHVNRLTDDIPRQLYVIVGKLADLGVVNTHDLGLLARAQTQTRDQVHDEEDDAGSAERVGEAGCAVGKLVAELDVVTVEPPTRDDGDAVKSGNVVGSEEGGEDVADDATDAVLGEDVESVIDSDPELDLGGEIAAGGAYDTEDNRRPGGNVSGRGRDGNETSDGTRTEADGRPLPLETIIEDAPCHTADGGSKIGYDASHDGAHVGTKGATAVEAEPSDPQEHGPEDYVGHVVRAVVELVSSVTTSLAKHDREGERSSAR